MKNSIKVLQEEQNLLIEKLRMRGDIDAKRILRYYDMPDLTRTPGNPVYLTIQAITNIPWYTDFDIIETPEVVWVYETFDLFGFSENHPARSHSDTYYVIEDRIMRTHTTVAWYYYLTRPEIQVELEQVWHIWALSYGKVYRKDEIDRSHMNVFHQIDGFYICEKSQKIIEKPELVKVLVELTKSIFWENVEYRIGDDTFPYTDPSVEIEVKVGDRWLEILGAGVIKWEVLDNLGIDSSRYNGWAYGPGIERIVMAKMNIPDIRLIWSKDLRVTRQWGNLDYQYEEVSKYPSTYRDISFIINANMSLNDYYAIIQDIAGDLVEEVVLLDRYENEVKFWIGKVSYTWRIIYRSIEPTLENIEVNEIQTEIREKTVEMLWVVLR